MNPYDEIWAALSILGKVQKAWKRNLRAPLMLASAVDASISLLKFELKRANKNKLRQKKT